MIEAILPDCVAVVDTTGDVTGVKLHAVEAAIIARAVEKRRREFVTARVCAHDALRQLGWPDQPIGAGNDREPQWPRGVSGSITHCDGYRAAAVARLADVVALGIDATPHAALSVRALTTIARPEEVTRLHEQSRSAAEIHLDSVLFSAKEAVYKAWFPLTRHHLGFEDARVAIDVEARTFRAELLVPTPSLAGAPPGFLGRWVVRDGLVLTAVARTAVGNLSAWHRPPGSGFVASRS